jgi:hypothetical protein
LLLLFQSYNIFNIVQFPTRISEQSSSAIDNTRFNAYVFTVSNWLYNHDAQCLALKAIHNLQRQKVQETTKKIVNKESTAQSQNKLHNGKWENIYHLNDLNVKFHLFLNAYLLAYESCLFRQKVTKNIITMEG